MSIDIDQLAFFVRESMKNINSTNKKINIDLSGGSYYLVTHKCDYIDTPTHILGMSVVVTHRFIQDDYLLCCSNPTADDLLFLKEFEDIREVY